MVAWTGEIIRGEEEAASSPSKLLPTETSAAASSGLSQLQSARQTTGGGETIIPHDDVKKLEDALRINRLCTVPI